MKIKSNKLAQVYYMQPVPNRLGELDMTLPPI